VGLDWEAANVGWNSSLAFDDSDSAGWHVPVARDVARYGGTSTNNIWASGDQNYLGPTPGYFRITFTLDNAPLSAHIGSTTLEDSANVVDDDAQIYVNGTLVVDDQDGGVTFFGLTDVTGLLHAGQNLLAAKVHDSYGIEEHFSLVLDFTTVPEPGSLIIVLGALVPFASTGSRRCRRRAKLH
jgi:hypothetical protein